MPAGVIAEMVRDTSEAGAWIIGDLRGSLTTLVDQGGDSSRTVTEGGTVVRGVPGPSRCHPLAGRFSPGASSRLKLTPVVQFDKITFSAWIRTTSASTLVEGVDSVALTLVGQQNSSGVWGSWGIHGGTVAFFRESTGRVLGNKIVSDGRWHHVGMTMPTTSTCNFWVDGALDLASTGNTFSGGLGYGMDTLGAHYKSVGVPGSFFDGDIAVIGMFGVALADVRLRAHYLAGLDRRSRLGRPTL